MRVLLATTTITKGQYAGEEGTGYNFTPFNTAPDSLPHGDISHTTGGHYQGTTGHAWGTLADGWTLRESCGGEWLAYEVKSRDKTILGRTAREMLHLGFLTIDEE